MKKSLIKLLDKTENFFLNLRKSEIAQSSGETKNSVMAIKGPQQFHL